MPEENTTAIRYKERSGDFIRGANVLCTHLFDGWLPSACLLLGFACELMAKRRLLLLGISEQDLQRAPYGHDISDMWRNATELNNEAESFVSELKKAPNPDGVDANFDWGLHFETLARAHSRKGDYSLRYHHGEIQFADPKAMSVVLGNIWRSEP